MRKPLKMGLRNPKQMTRAKAQSSLSSEQIRIYFSLRPWRLGAKNLVEVVFFICGFRDGVAISAAIIREVERSYLIKEGIECCKDK